MGDFFQKEHLFPFIDLALVNKGQDVPAGLQEKAIHWGCNPRDVVSKLKQAFVVYMHPDGFDKWTDILFFLAEKMSFPIKLVIIGGSDLALEDEHMEPFLAFFPQTQFWISNWCGSLDRCKLLPLGTNGQAHCHKTKQRLVGISFLLNYIGNPKREEFFQFLETHPEMLRYCLERAPYQDYCTSLSECYFSTCPMGEGFDTYRFWESLMVGTIPIVKDHPFYDTLLDQYPSIPIIRIKEWDDLPPLLPELSYETWNTLWSVADKSIWSKASWIQELQSIVSQRQQN